MRDIDIWANRVDELEHGIDMTEFNDDGHRRRISLSEYSRLTPNQLVKKLQDAIKPYDRDFNFKFIDDKTGKTSRNVNLRIEVDDVSEEILLHYDFK